MGLVVPGSGPGGRWFKSTRPDHFFQSLTRPRFPLDWVHLGPTSASRVPLPLQFAHGIQDASVYSAMLFANWNDQSTLSPNPQVHHFQGRTPCRDERHGAALASNRAYPVWTAIFSGRCPLRMGADVGPYLTERHRHSLTPVLKINVKTSMPIVALLYYGS
jgi:hypothetical protein